MRGATRNVFQCLKKYENDPKNRKLLVFSDTEYDVRYGFEFGFDGKGAKLGGEIIQFKAYANLKNNSKSSEQWLKALFKHAPNRRYPDLEFAQKYFPVPAKRAIKSNILGPQRR